MKPQTPRHRGYRGLPLILTAAFSLILAAGFFWNSQISTAKANFPDYQLAESTYPKIVGTRIDSCSLCHTSTPNLNAYGAAYKAKGRGMASSLTSIEANDSDGDGFSNIAEITALTFPGDAQDFPVAASATPTQVSYPPPATSTTLPPTLTSAAPTATKAAPTATSVGPTATKVPPTATSVGPTATKAAPTATKTGPTATKAAPTATKAATQPVMTKTPGPTPVVQCVKNGEKENDDLKKMSSKDRETIRRGNPCPTGYHPRERDWEHTSSGTDLFSRMLKKISALFGGNK
jgi:hypothetical protein